MRRARNAAVVVAKGDVEADLVYPILRGRDVSAWNATPSGHFVLPHRPDDLGQPLTVAELRKEYPKADSWLRRNHGALSARKTPPNRNWNMSSTGDDWCRVDGPLKHMSGAYSVIFREITTEPSAAFVEAEMSYDLKRVVKPLIDHKLSFLSLNCRNEALYITAMLNSTPITDLFQSFVSGTSVSPAAIEKAPIPKYDDTSSEMVKLAELANEIVAVPGNEKASVIEANRPLMDELVLQIIGAAADYRAQERRDTKNPTLAEDGRTDVLF